MVAVYLSIANPTIEFPTRHTIDGWISTSLIKNRLVRHLGETGTILGFSLMVSLIWPSSSGNVLVVTGATGVCMVSYIIPVMNHFLLFFSKWVSFPLTSLVIFSWTLELWGFWCSNFDILKRKLIELAKVTNIVACYYNWDVCRRSWSGD